MAVVMHFEKFAKRVDSTGDLITCGNPAAASSAGRRRHGRAVATNRPRAIACAAMACHVSFRDAPDF